MERNKPFETAVGEGVQIRILRHATGVPQSLSATVEAHAIRSLSVLAQAALPEGAVVGIETSSALILAEAETSCRGSVGVQQRFKILQTSPMKSDLHNMMVAINSRGVGQTQGAPVPVGRKHEEKRTA